MSAPDDTLMLRICRGHNCGKRADAIEAEARKTIEQEGYGDEVEVGEEACFGKCFLGPNVLVERLRCGKRNEQAMFAVMMNQKHPDMRFEHQLLVEDVPKMIRWHVKAFRRARKEESNR